MGGSRAGDTFLIMGLIRMVFAVSARLSVVGTVV